MEATFTFKMQRQQKVLYDPIQNQSLRLLLKCPTQGVVEAVKETMGELFQNSTHHWKIKIDIVAMIMAWGLELDFPLEEVEWVMKMLFLVDLIFEVESLLEWAWPGHGFDYSECFENEEEGKT